MFSFSHIQPEAPASGVGHSSQPDQHIAQPAPQHGSGSATVMGLEDTVDSESRTGNQAQGLNHRAIGDAANTVNSGESAHHLSSAACYARLSLRPSTTPTLISPEASIHSLSARSSSHSRPTTSQQSLVDSFGSHMFSNIPLEFTEGIDATNNDVSAVEIPTLSPHMFSAFLQQAQSADAYAPTSAPAPTPEPEPQVERGRAGRPRGSNGASLTAEITQAYKTLPQKKPKMSSFKRWQSLYTELSEERHGKFATKCAQVLHAKKFSGYVKQIERNWKTLSHDERWGCVNESPQLQIFRVAADLITRTHLKLQDICAAKDAPVMYLFFAYILRGEKAGLFSFLSVVERHRLFASTAQRTLDHLLSARSQLSYKDHWLDSFGQSKTSESYFRQLNAATVQSPPEADGDLELPRQRSFSPIAQAGVDWTQDVLADTDEITDRARTRSLSPDGQNTALSRSESDIEKDSPSNAERTWQKILMLCTQEESLHEVAATCDDIRRNDLTNSKEALQQAWRQWSEGEQRRAFRSLHQAHFLLYAIEAAQEIDVSIKDIAPLGDELLYEMVIAFVIHCPAEIVYRFLQNIAPVPEFARAADRAASLTASHKVRCMTQPQASNTHERLVAQESVPEAEAESAGETSTRRQDPPSRHALQRAQLFRIFVADLGLGMKASSVVGRDDLFDGHLWQWRATQQWISWPEPEKTQTFSLLPEGLLAKTVLDASLLYPKDEHKLLESPYDTFPRILLMHFVVGGQKKVKEFLDLASTLGWLPQWKHNAKDIVDDWRGTLARRSQMVSG